MTAAVDPPFIRLLIVEDNPGDVRLLRELCRDSAYPLFATDANDGRTALEYLRRQGKYSEYPRPDLILLDLNLPGMDGREVLAEVRSDPELNKIPTVIFTASSAHEDRHLAETFHADGFLRKPVSQTDLEDLLKRLDILPSEVDPEN